MRRIPYALHKPAEKLLLKLPCNHMYSSHINCTGVFVSFDKCRTKSYIRCQEELWKESDDSVSTQTITVQIPFQQAFTLLSSHLRNITTQSAGKGPNNKAPNVFTTSFTAMTKPPLLFSQSWQHVTGQEVVHERCFLGLLFLGSMSASSLWSQLTTGWWWGSQHHLTKHGCCGGGRRQSVVVTQESKWKENEAFEPEASEREPDCGVSQTLVWWMLVWACTVDVQVDVLHNYCHCVCDCMLCERTAYVPLTIVGEAVGEVKTFKFLGTTISCD